MAAIKVTVEEVELENSNGHEVSGVKARCQECHHEVQSFGTSERSVKRCMFLLRDECPYGKEEGQSNFYKCAGPFHGYPERTVRRVSHPLPKRPFEEEDDL